MVKTPFSLVVCRNLPIFEQLQLEEALLRADSRNWCLINSSVSPAIVMGISGKPEKLISPLILAEKKIPIIRRFSGGGTVYVDSGTHFVTWICNSNHVNIECCPSKIHRWTADFFSNAMPNLNVSLQEYDYVIGERKWAGNAQYLRKDRWLHHSSILWDFDDKQMECLLMPEKMPIYRYSRNHSDFLCRLCEYLPCRETFENSVIQQIKSQFDVIKVLPDEITPLLQLPHRKTTTML